jgi:tRNA (guanine-N7-)-methyltransferase
MPLTVSRLFGRRKGRPLRVRKSRLMDDLLPRLEITLPESGFDPQGLFAGAVGAPRDIWLEIGFGGGEHLAQQAMRHPEIGFIGCEPFRNGIASLLDHIDAAQATDASGDGAACGNIRIFPDDARVLLDALPDRSVARCFVLFADPWPKSRHAERRFIGRDNIARLARVMKPGAELRLATDDPTLSVWMRGAMAGAPGFSLLRDAATPPKDWIRTRYEDKGIKAGRVCAYLQYVRDKLAGI